MSTALAIDVSGWDIGGKFALLAALAQSVDEFTGIVEQTQIAISDPDWPDKRAASHKIVDYVYDAVANFVTDPTNVQQFADTLPANATNAEAIGLLERFLPAGGKLRDALLWVVDHLDEFMEYVLPWLLIIFEKSPKLLPFKGLFKFPRLRAA